MPVRRPYIPKKHTKTFTGCWTCRVRRLKCDEGRPECSQCRRKGIQCEGYGVRLHWLAPETGHDKSLDESADATLYSRPCRSRITLESNQTPLPCYKVSEILLAIDELEASQLSICDIENGPFGVFDSTNSPADQLIVPPSPKGDNQDPDFDFSDLTTSSISDALHLGGGLEISQTCITTNSFSPPRIPVSENDTSENILLDIFPTQDANEDHFNFDILDQPAQDVHNNHQITPAEFDSRQLSPDNTIHRCPPAKYLPHNEQFLMHHYANRVVHLFCVLDNPKSPWKTIHLPRAIQSTGEMIIHGSTSRIRSALRNALLSISAFCLSNDSKIRSDEDEALKWANDATCFRGVAIKLLTEAVEMESLSKTRPKYKEFLATILSMISINVMSGDIENCGVYLDAAHRLIIQTKCWKHKYSNQAEALHRIYFFLRTIHESTAVRGDSEKAKYAEELAIGTLSSKRPIFQLELPTKTILSIPDNTPAAKGSYESIYAVPQSLLLLLSRATRLVNEVVDIREELGIKDIPVHLQGQCDDLEKAILDWSPDATLSCASSGKASNSQIIQHMTRAFHNAIIIYFAQHIRLLGYRHLQMFVQKVIESIEVVEEVKAETQILAAPLYWPAFIGASEAFDPVLQDRFRSWYNQVEVYGIEGVRTGIIVLLDVWEEGPCGRSRTTSRWRMVATRTGTNLMLT